MKDLLKIFFLTLFFVLPQFVFASGDLQVSKIWDNQVRIVPKNTSQFSAAKYAILANGEDVKIENLKVYVTGLIRRQDINKVWIIENDYKKIGRSANLNSDYISNINLKFSPLVIKKGETKFITINISLNSETVQSGSTLFVEFKEDSFAGDFKNIVIDQNSNVEKQIQTSGFSSGILSFDPIPVSYSTRIGNISEIGRFKLKSIDSSKDIILKAVTFKNEGTAKLPFSLGDSYIDLNGKKITKNYSIDGDNISFEFIENLKLKSGDTKLFRVMSKIVATKYANNLLRLKLDNEGDFFAKIEGSDFGPKIEIESPLGTSMRKGKMATVILDY